MDRTERFYTIDRLLREKRGVTLRTMMDKMEVSRATIRRDLEYMRDRLAAPIVWNSNDRVYSYCSDKDDQNSYSLPGLWFNASEVHALLTMEHLLSSLQPGLLEPHIGPLRNRIRSLLDTGDHSSSEVAKRIRVLHMAARGCDSSIFGAISHALLRRYKLEIDHLNRVNDKVIRRLVSPQRLAHYRDNWYLDCWCHLRQNLRSFSVDAVQAATVIESDRAKYIDDTELEKTLGAGYGIFSGSEIKQAILKFSPKAARWVSGEKWHSQQQGKMEEDGSYILKIPYSADTELVMDIIRYGKDVLVIAPKSLQEAVIDKLKDALTQYKENG